jgi:hypothetical protein
LLVLAACGGDDGAPAATSFDVGTGSATTEPATGGATTSATGSGTTGGTTRVEPGSTSSSTTDESKFDLEMGPDASLEEECPRKTMHMAEDGNLCALNTVVYDRQGGILTLSVTAGQLFECTDPDVEVVYATDQLGYEGFFTILRESADPDVFYFIIADDDFIEPSMDCGIEENTCEPSCILGVGGDVCRAFVEDFVPIVAAQFVGSPLAEVAFERRQAGACCMSAMPGQCSASVSTYTEYIVSGPDGTMHFVFEDGFAFLVEMGWDHQPRELVSGDAEFEFDLCDIPVPEG